MLLVVYLGRISPSSQVEIMDVAFTGFGPNHPHNLTKNSGTPDLKKLLHGLCHTQSSSRIKGRTPPLTDQLQVNEQIAPPLDQ